MKFHLNHTPAKPGFEITHSDRLFLAGSCFSENISALLQQHKFNTHANPSGIVFNPLSLAASFEHILSLTPLQEDLLLQRGDSYFSFLHHSSVSKNTKQELINSVAEINEAAHNFLKEADILIITFGSAFYYHHLSLDTTVANCHKQPGPVFEKRLLSQEELVNRYNTLIQQLQQFNPTLKIIFTISPVKHLKDGLIENTISKATLILGIHELIQQHNNCFYFPAYELVTDDLRDYRFYKADLAHPNEQAIDYVWQKFSECYFNESTQTLNQKIEKLNLALNHKHLHGNSKEADSLLAFINRQKEDIQQSASWITFE